MKRQSSKIYVMIALAGKVYSHAMTAKKSTKKCDACFESLVYVFNYLNVFVIYHHRHHHHRYHYHYCYIYHYHYYYYRI